MRPEPTPSSARDDPFRASQRWLVRLGARFYFPIAAAVVLLITGVVVRDALMWQTGIRRLVDLLMVGAACLLVLFWRAERRWGRGETGWLVRLVQPGQAFVWAGLATAVIAVGLIGFIRLAGPDSPAANYLWPLFLFPLLFLSERGETVPFLFILALACGLLALLRLAVDNTLAGVLTPPLWLATLATSNYYLGRRHHLLQLRTELLRQIAGELSNTPDIEASLEAVAGLIGQRLRQEHLRLWLRDEATHEIPRATHSGQGFSPGQVVSAARPRPSAGIALEYLPVAGAEIAPRETGAAGGLSLRAAYGTPRELWQGLRLEPGQGVAGRVLQSGRAERWDDLARCPHHLAQPPFAWARSALAVPILNGGQAVGVLEALSREIAGFWEMDQEHLGLMADSIGLALARSQHARQEAARLRDTLSEAVSRLNDCTTLEEMFDTLAREARDRLGADLVVLYQLAPGTGYPLTPPLFQGSLREPERLRRPALPQHSVLFDLLEGWQPHYSAEALADPLLNRGSLVSEDDLLEADAPASQTLPYGLRNRFLAREAVRSVAFLPLGARGERVGALFLHYRQPREFSPLDRLTLEAFASLAAESINRERSHWRRYEAFGGVLFGVHGPLTLSADSLRRLTGLARDSLRTDPARAEAALDQAGQVARKLEVAAMLTRLAQRDQVDEARLQEALRRAAAKIIPLLQPACRVRIEVPDEADDLPFPLLDALYCLAIEAIVNAARHGQAARVEVEVEIDPGQVSLSVQDNGQGFEPALARPGPNGIFEGLELARQQFAARGQVDSQPGRGARLEVVFPCLPDMLEGGGP